MSDLFSKERLESYTALINEICAGVFLLGLHDVNVRHVVHPRPVYESSYNSGSSYIQRIPIEHVNDFFGRIWVNQPRFGKNVLAALSDSIIVYETWNSIKGDYHIEYLYFSDPNSIKRLYELCRESLSQ